MKKRLRCKIGFHCGHGHTFIYNMPIESKHGPFLVTPDYTPTRLWSMQCCFCGEDWIEDAIGYKINIRNI